MITSAMRVTRMSSSIFRTWNVRCPLPHRHSITRSMETVAVSITTTASPPQLPQLNREIEDDDDGDDDDEEEENLYDRDDNDQPWKTLLDMPGRAAWRVAEQEQLHKNSASLRHAQNTVLEDGKASWYSTTSNKQLLKTLAEISSSHRSLANRRERERLRAHRNESPKQGKGGGGGGAEQGADDANKLVYYGPIETLANVKHRLYPNYAVTRRILRETKSLLSINQPFKPKRVLDFGMGCGSASAASLDVFPESIEWIHGIEASQAMREGSQRFLEEFIQHSRSSTGTNDSVADGSGPESMTAMSRPPPRITQAAHLSSSSSGRYFDLCLFGYTAMELPHNASTLAAAALLWEKLNPNGGILVMIEPGTPDGFSSIRQVRNMLLDCCPPHSSHGCNNDKHDDDENETLEECHILAPCTHNRACPMERSIFSKPLGKRQSDQTQQDVIAEGDEDTDDEDDHDDSDSEQEESNEHDEEAEEGGRRKGFCSFVHSMPAAGGRNKSEKFSYLVAQKRTRGHSSGMSMGSPENSETTMTKNEDNIDEPFCFENVRLSELLNQMLQNEGPTPAHYALARQAASLGSKFLDSDQDDLGLEFVRGDTNRSSFGRIIHAPKKKKAHVMIDCCSNGRIVRHKIPKSMSQRAPGIYAAARKSRWGGLWLGSKHTEDKSYKKED